jgi:hypothetical protein
MSARDGAWAAGLAIAAILGAWLRLHGLGAQLVLDDEWHAIHKLMSAGYGDIFRSFGYADHSIPLTLLYKAMAATVGLTEINMRIVQALSGIALVGLSAAIAWYVSRNRAATLLCAFLVAGAPFLVLYSRFARPYAITTLLVTLVLAGLWVWRERRRAGPAAAICFMTALSAWLHPISAAFPAVAMVFILAEDVVAGKAAWRRLARSAALGAAMAAGIALLLAAPILNDLGSLTAKAVGDHAGAYTVSRMLSLFAGGLPDAVTVLVTLVAAFGAWRVSRASPVLGAYLAVLAIVPVVLFIFLGARWTHQGHTFARYVFPVQLIFLLWASIGFVELARLALGERRAGLELAVAGIAAAAYLAVNPAIRQVATLGPWYGHVYHHFDYVAAHNDAALQYYAYDAPRFYHVLGAMPPGSAPVIEAPFSSGAPGNSFAFFATFHRQPEKMGMLHDLCLSGPYAKAPYVGEVPKDARFRFRNFVFLDDREAVLASGARYLLLHRDLLNGAPFRQADRCLAALTALYGPPVDIDLRLAVFDLRAAAGPRKLQ